MAEPAETKPTLLLGVRYFERKDNPPPGLVWWKGLKGETLGSIADDYGIRWIDLALYNWHTAKLAEVNWYLKHFVGCTLNNGKTYSFSGTEKSGWLLVPNIPPSVKKGPPRKVAVPRGGRGKYDIKLQVAVVEWLAGGSNVPVSGKWLYVFSGRGGVDFGYDPPPGPARIDGPPMAQPGSAFTLDFPGVFPIKERPDKLEYEILVTSKEGPSTSLMTAVSNLKDGGTPYYKVGSTWYFLSDPTILANALTEGRDKRTTHAFRNTSAVTIDLTENRRYYFLLSPLQLGPEALKYAMAHPKGLTPLLKPDENGAQWDPSNPTGPQDNHYVGPTADDIKSGAITLPVIDPYAWAEDIAESGYRDALEEYVKWLGINQKSSGKNETTKKLTDETGWTLDHFYVADILKTVRDSHPKPGSIDDELKDSAKWKKDLERWSTDLIQRNAEINANAHRSLIQLTEWMQGPGHTIIETAILKDTNVESSQDAIDVARGILHWNVCTEHMLAMEPGVAYLRDLFSRSGSVPTDVVLKSLELSSNGLKISKTNETASKYAYHGMLALFALKDFVSPPPDLKSNGTREDYIIKLADYTAARRDQLVKFLNDSKILPAKIAKVVVPPSQAPMRTSQVVATAVNSLLDMTDKWTTYIIDPNINIPRKFGLNWLANIEEWFGKRPTFAKFSNMGSTYALKLVALPLNVYNLYSAITTARYDYQQNQMTVNMNDYAQAIAGTTLALQDFLAEAAALLKSQGLQRVFPQLMTTAGGPGWGVGAARVSGIAGTTFATVNVLAMIVSGITTIISMERSRGKARSRGDYTAAKFYFVGTVGGVLMVGGGVAFGLALIEAGGIFSATGVGATVGVVLFLVGGILATIASIFGSRASSDDFQVFARKCFLGKRADEEPRFGSDAPGWSHALEKGNNSWPIDKQKRAIHNLLGQFSVKTNPDGLERNKPSFTGRVVLDITPGLFRPGGTVEVALHYDSKGAQQTASTIEWNPDGPPSHDYRIVNMSKNGLFDAAGPDAYFEPKDKSLHKIKVWLNGVKYDSKFGDLLTTVTVRYPDLPNVIRSRKLVIGASHQAVGRVGRAIVLKADSDEVTSAMFE